MTDDVAVRRVRTGDAGRVRALRLEMLADSPLAFITTLAEAAEVPHDEFVGRVTRAASGVQIGQFVAEAGHRLVGQTIGIVHPDRSDTTLLVAVYLTPAYRGRGLLGAIVDAAAAWSRECGRGQLELEVVTTNGRAVRAYRRLGFCPDGTPVPHPTIPLLTEQVMVRAA